MLALMGQWFRSCAMIQAGSNFSHQIEHRKRTNHVLVTDGIYSWSRHPSYFGFFWWAVGTQFILGNPLSILGYVLVLSRFFQDRIAYEEDILVQFFGRKYLQYQAGTPIRIPFIAK
jgi:protein-S-isoprenylcysteine O-methyltransferase